MLLLFLLLAVLGAVTGSWTSAQPLQQTGQLLVFPITAQLSPPETAYATDFANPEGLELSYAWYGPDCGSPMSSEGTTSETNGQFRFVWSHPHPPCDRTLEHDHVTITLEVTGGPYTIVCTYQGSATGEGGPCEIDEDSDPRDTERPDDIHSGGEPVEACDTVITGAFEPTQGVWQDDNDFVDKPTKRLTKVSPSETVAELPMVAMRRTLLFGIRDEGYDYIALRGTTNGSQDAVVAVRFESEQTVPSTIHTTPAQYAIPIDPPCTEESREFTLLVETPQGLPNAEQPFMFPSPGPYELRAQIVRDGGGPAGVPDLIVSGNVVNIPPLRVNFHGAYVGVVGTERSRLVAVTRFVERAAGRLRSETDQELPLVFPLRSEGGLVTTLGTTLNLTPIMNPPLSWQQSLVNAIGIGRELSAFEQADLRLSRINDFFTTGGALTNPPGTPNRYIVVLSRDDLGTVWGSGGINGFSNRKGGMVATDVNFRTVAHEIAHTTGRSGDSLGWLFSADEMLRDCGTDYHNEPLRVGNGVRIAPDNQRTRFDSDYHMMVAMQGNPAWWISQCTYWHLVHRLQEPLDPPVIQVRGLLSRIDDQPGGMLLPAYPMDGVVELESGAGGEAAVALRDASGALLGRFPFEPTWRLTTHGEDHTTHVRDLLLTSFGYQVPDLPGTARVDLEGPGGMLLHTLAYSATPPTVDIASPSSGASVSAEDGTATIAWTGADADGDSLLYTVLYSPNDGETWHMQALEIEDTEWPVAVDAESTEHLVRVIATDGVHGHEAEIRFSTGGGGIGFWIILLAVLGSVGLAAGAFVFLRLRAAQ